jgi:hypothetical protein
LTHFPRFFTSHGSSRDLGLHNGVIKGHCLSKVESGVALPLIYLDMMRQDMKCVVAQSYHLLGVQGSSDRLNQLSLDCDIPAIVTLANNTNPP